MYILSFILLENAVKTDNIRIIVQNIKVLRPSGPNYWENVEWIPYFFCKEYCSEC